MKFCWFPTLTTQVWPLLLHSTEKTSPPISHRQHNVSIKRANMSITLKDGLANQPLDHVLEDLLVRFVINVPEEDLSSIERVFFQVEEAQWFYTDFLKGMNPALPNMKMKSFAPTMLRKCPLVWKWGDPLDALSRFGKYKSTIPVRGIAMLNRDLTKVVLVQGTESNTWSFPRGKISKDEEDLECAIREVKEETGFDARNYVNEKDVLERTIGGKNFKIYVAKGVPDDYEFEPAVRNEIANIKWFDIKSLRKSVQKNSSRYFVVAPMMEPMNRWINKNKGVVNKEELMREAEVRLKALMGIDSAPANVNVDAGRELLNILQSAQPQQLQGANVALSSMQQPPQYIQMTLPQHLQSIYTGMSQMAPQFYPPQMPMMPPAELLRPTGNFGPPNPQQIPIPMGQHAPQQFPPQPFSPMANAGQPQVAAPSQAPSALSNSKELLSILKRDPKPKKPEASVPQQQAQSPPAVVNRGEELLKLFKKKPQQDSTASTPTISTPPPAVPRSETPSKKITLLKREAPENDASATLLGILGRKPPTPDTPKSQATEGDVEPTQRPALSAQTSNTSASAELLGLLNRKPPTRTSSQAAPEPLRPEPTPATNEAASSVLLGVLNREKPAVTPEDKKATNEIVGMLKQQIKKKDDSNTKSINTTRAKPSQQFPLTSATDILSTINRKSATPESARFTPQPQIPQEDFEDFANFEDFEDFDEISESQHGIYNSIVKSFDMETDEEDEVEDIHTTTAQPPSTNNAGAGLLLLLNGGKPPSKNLSSLQETYGAYAPQTPAFVSPQPQQVRHSTNNGADLLLLLKRDARA